MTGADKLIGGNSNITLYYFHGRANVVNLMWLAYVKSIRILLSRWPIKMYFTELLDRCKADIWRHAGCNFCKQEWYYLLRYGTGVIIMASKPTKTVRHQKFLTEYTAKWDFIVPSVKGETYASNIKVGINNFKQKYVNWLEMHNSKRCIDVRVERFKPPRF